MWRIPKQLHRQIIGVAARTNTVTVDGPTNEIEITVKVYNWLAVARPAGRLRPMTLHEAAKAAGCL